MAETLIWTDSAELFELFAQQDGTIFEISFERKESGEMSLNSEKPITFSLLQTAHSKRKHQICRTSRMRLEADVIR